MDIGEEVHAGGRVAAGVVLVGFGVECCAFCDRKLWEVGFAADLEDLFGFAMDVGNLVGLAVNVEDVGAVCSMLAREGSVVRAVTNVWSICRAAEIAS